MLNRLYCIKSFLLPDYAKTSQFLIQLVFSLPELNLHLPKFGYFTCLFSLCLSGFSIWYCILLAETSQAILYQFVENLLMVTVNGKVILMLV